MRICPRCKKETNVTKGSLYTGELVCLDCIEREKQHPTYEEVRKKELEEVRKGNYNFITELPDDLK